MTMIRKARVGLALWLLLVVALALTAVWRWPGTQFLATDFPSLLPHSAADPWLTRATTAASSSFDRQLVLLVSANDPATADAFLAHSVEALANSGFADPAFEQEQARRWQALSTALYPYRWGLLTSADRRALEADAATAFAQFRGLLYSPLGLTYLRGLERDPTGHFGRYLRSFRPAPPAADAGRRLATLSVPAEGLGFDALPSLHAAYRELQKQAQAGGAELHATGVPLYSAFAVVSARQEMSTIGIASLVLLVAILLFFLRSPSGLLLTLTCVGAGLGAGFASTVLLLGEIHLITLVFGATLIGIAADYALHYLAHSRLPGWTADAALGKVLRGLALGVTSSALAFVALVLLPFPGIRQMGVFMASGLLASFATVCLLFPALYRRAPVARPPGGLFATARPRSPLAPGYLLAVALALVAGLALAPADDDIRAFSAAPAELAVAQERIRALTGSGPDSRFLLLRAPDEQVLLQRERALLEDLEALAASGGLDRYTGIGQVLPPASEQRESRELWRALLADGTVEEHLRALGFGAEALARLRAAIAADPGVADIALLADLDLPLGVEGYLGCAALECASWVRLSGVTDAAALEGLVAAHPHVQLADPVADINSDIEVYRGAVGWTLLLAAIGVGGLLTLLAGPTLALRMLVIPFTACALSLAMLIVVQGSYSLVNLMGLLLVFGVGLDYG
ncbi:MAG: MMPL family transporter, partial [Halioglobus sp.]|nr:MMPL family transporter [Halioglobus sp.]